MSVEIGNSDILGDIFSDILSDILSDRLFLEPGSNLKKERFIEQRATR